jgi:hypothetical protein
MGLSLVASVMTRKGSCENRLSWLTLLVSCFGLSVLVVGQRLKL